MKNRLTRGVLRILLACLLFSGPAVARSAFAEVLNVPAGGDLQAALNAAQPGDVILLEAGATYVGDFVLPPKPGSSFITVKSNAPENRLPPPGTRTSPAYAPYLPKLKARSVPAIMALPNSHHWRFENLEFLQNATPNDRQAAIIRLGTGDQTLSEVPDQIVLDRIYAHGEPGDVSRRGVELQSRNTSIINSYFSDFKDDGFDSQAIAGWNGPGPFLIENNYLEAAGENVMFGGADPRIQNLVPSDITIRRNHFSKPRTWKVGDPAYAGRRWTVKNLLELKSAQRVTIEGNLFEQCWTAGQAGDALVVSAQNQSNTAPWTTVRDITIRNNVFRHVGGAIVASGTDPNRYTVAMGQGLTISNNLAYDVGGDVWTGTGRFLQLGNITPNVTIDHNTWDGIGSSAVVLYGQTNSRPTPITNFVFTNNLFKHNTYGIYGDSAGVGDGALNTYAPGGTVRRNVIAGGAARDYSVAPDNFFPGVDQFLSNFVDAAAGNYHLSPSSPYRNMATDGTDVGVNMAVLQGAVTGTSVAGLSAPLNLRILR